jgi:hypothetical protein
MLKRLVAVAAAISSIKLLFYFLDSLPQFYGGDSFAYLNTSRRIGFPLDRSFVYGILIRVIEKGSHSLAPLILFQTAAGLFVCLFLYYCAYRVLNLPFIVSFTLACLFAADPIQLLYERHVMAETLGGLFLAGALTVSLSYIKKPCAWKLLLIPFLGVLSTAFRLNSYAPAWFLGVSLPVLVFLKELFRRRSTSDAIKVVPKQLGYSPLRIASHLIISVACFLIILSQYAHLYGRLEHRRHAITYTQGFFMLSGLWSIVIPEDAPDPRLAKIIATKVSFSPTLNPVLERNAQRYGEGGLISRWEKAPIEGPGTLHDDIAQETAFNAIRRAPFQVLQEARSTCWEILSHTKARVLEIYDAPTPITEQQCQWLKKYFGQEVTEDWKEKSTLTKNLLMKCRGWFCVLLLSPIWGLAAAAFFWRSDYFIPLLLIIAVGILDFLPSCIFVVPNARLLHPLDFGVFLMLGMIVCRAAECFRKR